VPRQVTLVLQSAEGALVGALDPFTVELPWWSEIAGVVEAARRERGGDVAVLRLLHAEPDPNDPSNMGGTVTYAAELLAGRPADLRAVDADDASAALGDDPLRLPYARPGGPAHELGWAGQALAANGREPSGPPQQQRTWNLSSIWVLPTTTGPVWLKSVPPFFAHEGRVIEWLADPALPPLIASSRERVLMADIAGVDQYDASLPILERAVTTLVAMQHRVCDRLDELFALGLPDWRWPALRRLVDDVVDRHRHELDDAERRGLDALLDGFAARCDAIDACDLPMTLVHGDFHPGNLRGDGEGLRILDWGDCGVGHPLFDVAAMVERLDAARSGPLATRWAREWIERRPGSDPRRAAMLVEPIAALRQAVVYRGFLDRIEPSERCYHATDPALWLRRAAGTPDLQGGAGEASEVP
jgi:hypothetical protein